MVSPHFSMTDGFSYITSRCHCPTYLRYDQPPINTDRTEDICNIAFSRVRRRKFDFFTPICYGSPTNGIEWNIPTNAATFCHPVLNLHIRNYSALAHYFPRQLCLSWIELPAPIGPCFFVLYTTSSSLRKSLDTFKGLCLDTCQM